MKKVFLSLAVAFAALMSASSYAADPDLVVNATGTQAIGLGEALGVRILQGAQSPTTEVKFPGGTNWAPVADNASYSKYAYIKARLIALGAIQVGTSDVYLVAPKAVNVDCFQGTSRVWFANTNNPESYSDGCAYRDKVKANAN